jgi:hypothetical protein
LFEVALSAVSKREIQPPVMPVRQPQGPCCHPGTLKLLMDDNTRIAT